MKELIKDIKECTICKDHLELECRPVVSLHPDNQILIIGQAPGIRVHNSGIPWDDKSGDTLREWLGVTKEQFYNDNVLGILPMGFCYPGKGKSGDLPPRKECAPFWHETVLSQLSNVKLTLLIGQYAQKYYLDKSAERTLTATVQNAASYLPQYLPLPHPSPRNNIWMKKNPWFKKDIIPLLSQVIDEIKKG